MTQENRHKPILNKLVTIVIPVYNGEQYLKKCLNSVIDQTYPRLEIILVDDGSEDKSGKICDAYAKHDPRIKVLHQGNGGLSAARNAGLKIFTGQYIYFLDSDDYLEKNCIELHLCAITKADADISVSAHNVIHQAGNVSFQASCGNLTMNNKEALERMLYDEGVNVSSCNKLFAAKLFKHITFPENRVFEEVATTYRLIDVAHKIVSIEEATYNYVMHVNSITTSNFSKKHMDLIKSTKEMCSYIKKKYPSLTQACDRKIMYGYLSTLVKIVNSNASHPKEKRECLAYIKTHRNKALKDPRLPKRDRIALYSLVGGYPTFCLFWKIYCLFSGRKQSTHA